MKKGEIRIDVHMHENKTDKPFFWCICEWTGRTWYNTGKSGRSKTAQQAWEQAYEKYNEDYQLIK